MPVPVRPNIGQLIKAPSGGFKLAFQNAAPTGMVIVGCIGIIGGVVLACNATLKADAILDEIEADIEKVNHVREITTEDRYSHNDYQHDMTLVYAKGGAKLAKLYLPSALLIVGSIILILGGHKILLNRYVASCAAAEAIQKGYDAYRDRVRDELGVDADRKYAYGVEDTVGTITEVDKDGKSHKKKIKAQKVNREIGLASPYAFYWDDTCNGWDENVYYNETFLIQKQKDWNRKLATAYPINGFVTLAEIKKDLGVLVRPQDIRVGWKYDPNYNPEEHNGKDQIDLGIFSPLNSNAINGSEMVYILEPNIQGDLYYSAPSKFAK